jgi:AraC-type DNA-binding domain-containing proteins
MDKNHELAGTKRGYLNKDFQFFHLKDRKGMEFDFHFHEFSKIIILISGKVTYYIEGVTYRLKPWDILLVSNKEVHKTVIEPGELYERIVIWINPAFLEKHNTADCNLLNCFELVSGNISNLIRLDAERLRKIRGILLQLEEALKSNEFGSRLLGNSLFTQFIIYVNRCFLGGLDSNCAIDMEYDTTVNSIIKYINENLGRDLSIDILSEKFFVSRYYIMHKFKTCTGYSIHNYIIQKRLIVANALIKSGKPATEASLECGFNDYSSFMRAFKKMFGYSPRQYLKNHQVSATNLPYPFIHRPGSDCLE